MDGRAAGGQAALALYLVIAGSSCHPCRATRACATLDVRASPAVVTAPWVRARAILGAALGFSSTRRLVGTRAFGPAAIVHYVPLTAQAVRCTPILPGATGKLRTEVAFLSRSCQRLGVPNPVARGIVAVATIRSDQLEAGGDEKQGSETHSRGAVVPSEAVHHLHHPACEKGDKTWTCLSPHVSNTPTLKEIALRRDEKR